MKELIYKVYRIKIRVICFCLLLCCSARPFSSATANPTEQHFRYLPFVINDWPLPMPLGFESSRYLSSDSRVLAKAIPLSPGYIRINRVGWEDFQPDGPEQAINWNQPFIVAFENELRMAKAQRLEPIITIYRSPLWAVTIPTHNCSAIIPEYYDEYANFLSQMVQRYSAEEFDVHIWELGNEPDVSPELLGNVGPFYYGCWGDAADPYYGGGVYGEMLKVVAPAMRAVDPHVKIWIGGLLLDSPNSGAIRPELFFEGILAAGAGNLIDGVPYHVYTWYRGDGVSLVDHDIDLPVANFKWKAWGGSVIGKATFLRQYMTLYGISKPLYLNEYALTCDPICEANLGSDPARWDDFYEMQAYYIIRTTVRGIGAGILGFTWYTLDGPGWRYCGLLDSLQQPKPAYTAYANLASQIRSARYLGMVTTGNNNLEGYQFLRGDRLSWVQVLWTKYDTIETLSVPDTKFIAAYTWDGVLFTPQLVGTDRVVVIGFRPVFIIRRP